MAASRWTTPRCGRGHRRTVHHFIYCGHPLHRSRPSLRVPMNGAPRRLVTFLATPRKVSKRRRALCAAFCFCFFVAAISAVYRAVRKLAFTLISKLNHRVAQTGSRRRPPPIASKNSGGEDGSVVLSSIWGGCAVRTRYTLNYICALRIKTYACAWRTLTRTFTALRSVK